MRLTPPEVVADPKATDHQVQQWLKPRSDKEACLSTSIQWLITLYNMPEQRARSLLGLK